MRYKAEYFFGKLTSSTIIYLLLPIMLQRLKQNKTKKKKRKENPQSTAALHFLPKLHRNYPLMLSFHVLTQ